MARLELYIGTTKVGYTQKADLSEEMGDTDPIQTFDGPVPSLVAAENTYTVSFDVVRYEGSAANFKKLKQLIRSTKTTPQPIKIVEQVTFADKKSATYTQQISDCTLSSNKVSFDPESRTITSLEFKGTGLKEFENNKEF